MPTCITSTPFPVPWLQACRAGSGCRRAAAAAPGPGLAGIPVLLPRAVPAPWSGCCRWPALPGSAPAGRWWFCLPWGRLPCSGGVGWCWILSTLFAARVPVASGRRAVRADPGRMRAGELRVLSAWPQRRRCGRLCRRVRFRENEPGLLRCPGSVRGRPGAGAADPGVGGSAWIRGFPRQAVLFPEADLQWSAKACNVFQATAARERKRLAGREANPFKTITFNRFDLPCG